MAKDPYSLGITVLTDLQFVYSLYYLLLDRFL